MKRLDSIQHQNLIFLKIFLASTALLSVLKIVVA